MGFTWTETSGEWSVSQNSGTAVYFGEGEDFDTDTLELARLSLEGVAPGSLGGINRTNVEVREVGDCKFVGTATYGKGGGRTRPATGEARIRGNTKGGTVHITQAMSHQNDYAASGVTAPNFKGVIGVDGSGSGTSIVGCDVPAQAFDFEITRYVSDADFTNDYLHRITTKSVSMNNAFVSITVDGKTISFDAGELLYLGCTYSKRQPEGDWEVVMSFAGSPNVSAGSPYPLSGVITSASGNITFSKLGWDYLWVRYGEKDITAGGKTYSTKQPIDAHTEQVIYDIDFSTLDP